MTRNGPIWAVIDADTNQRLYETTSKADAYLWAVDNLPLTVPWVVIAI